MVIATMHAGARWSSVHVEPYGPLSLEPAATILNYGQGIFEGLKAWRTEKGRIVLFRPHKNAERCQDGAHRMLMPKVPIHLFVQACEIAVKENAEYVPPVGQGALYLRPLLFGSGADLGVKPSTEYTFVVFVSPTGSYFGAGSVGARMRLCIDHNRAAPLGVGNVKCAGNYAQCFKAQKDAKGDGFSDVIYTDVDGKYIEEAAASNFFVVDENNVVHTPQLGSILPGITRDSVITLLGRNARRLGIQLQVGKVSVDTVMNSKEAFLSGTGAGIIPIEHISSGENGRDYDIPGEVTQTVSKLLSDIQTERSEDKYRWLHDPFAGKTQRIDSFIEPNF